MFKLNNDLNNIKLDLHNSIHLIVSCVLVPFLTYFWGILIASITTYSVGVLWDIGDGFKPYWTTYEDKYGGNWVDFLRKELLYSNGFSFQDVFVWDLGGTLVGIILIVIYNLI